MYGSTKLLQCKGGLLPAQGHDSALPGDRRHEGQGGEALRAIPASPGRTIPIAQGVKLTRGTCKSCRLYSSSGPLQGAPGRKARTTLLVSGLISFPYPWHAGCVLRRQLPTIAGRAGCARSRGYTGWPAPPSPVFPPRGVRAQQAGAPSRGRGWPTKPPLPCEVGEAQPGRAHPEASASDRDRQRRLRDEGLAGVARADGGLQSGVRAACSSWIRRRHSFRARRVRGVRPISILLAPAHATLSSTRGKEGHGRLLA